MRRFSADASKTKKQYRAKENDRWSDDESEIQMDIWFFEDIWRQGTLIKNFRRLSRVRTKDELYMT